MTISISASGIALDGPLVAGERVSVAVSGLALAAEDKPTLALLARFPDALLASVELAEDAQTPGTWTGELDTATKQTALFFATARADERRDAALELVAGRVSLARLTVPMANSALCPKPDGSPFASPVYIPVPGPPGTGGDPYDQAPEMDGEAAAGTVDEYARGDHRHPTDTTRQAVIEDLAAIRSGAAAGATAVQPSALAAYRTASAQDAIDAGKASAADVTAIQNIIPSTATPTNKLVTAADVPPAQVQADWSETDTSSKAYIANKPTIPGPAPSPSTATPQMDGTGAAGTATTYARGDHQHPSDTTRVKFGPTLVAPGLGPVKVLAKWERKLPGGISANEQADIPLAGNLAAAFSTSSPYAVGDYVTYEGVLYKCTTAVATAGAWNAANWTAVAVTDEMGADTPLPFDAEVEYLQVGDGSYDSTKEWRIETGIYVSSYVDLHLEAMITQGPSLPNHVRIGGWWSAFQYMVNANDSDKLQWWRGGTGNTTNVSGVPIGEWFTLDTRGENYSLGNSSGTATKTLGYYASSDFPIVCRADGRIRAARISLNGYPIFDGVPVRVGQTGYLYDKVTGKLFGVAASSTAAATPGPDKSQPTITTPGRIVELTPAIRYAFASPTPTVSGTTATVACEDRAINGFTVTTGVTSLTITPPAAVTGRARDFFCRVTLTDASLPTVTLSGGTIDIGSTEVAGMTQGVNLLMFTEIASGHWLASRRSAS